MKKINLALLLVCLCLSHSIQAQNPALILAPKYLDGVTPFPMSLPTSSTPDGYSEQTAKAAQNIILDNTTGKIMFFIVDENVYDRKGKLIGVLRIGSSSAGIVNNVMAEVSVVPMNNRCNEYFIFSTRDHDQEGIPLSEPFYSKIKLFYDANDNLSTDSGLEEFGDPEITAKSIIDLITNEYSEGNDELHLERALFAVSPWDFNNQRFLWVLNASKLFKLTMSNNNLYYGFNEFIDLNVIFPGYTVDPQNLGRQELEVVQLPNNGVFRIACPAKFIYNNDDVGYYGVMIFDLNQSTGAFIAGSQRLIKYDSNQNNASTVVNIKGMEFSQDGTKIYLTHNMIGTYQSGLDMFDLTVPGFELGRINLSYLTGTANFQDSQIEAIEGGEQGALIIPYNTGVAKISNANAPTFPTDYTYNYLPLSSYTADCPWSLCGPAEKVRYLQDNIDGYDYASVPNIGYDHFIYNASATTDLLWEPNVGGTSNNPLTTTNSNTIYIKEELRIPAGRNITIRNMTFKFAPGAKVVIERGVGLQNGGKLTLVNSTFTVADICEEDMWKGVEVWGYTNNTQSLSGTKQGTFIVNNQSTVEHAYVGAMASKRLGSENGATNLDAAYSGGIIRVLNASTFFNNQIGVYVNRYNTALGYMANKCYFEKSTFKWNGPLKKAGELYKNQVQLNYAFGVFFRGNTFLNNSSNTPSNLPFYLNGIGIFATNSIFTVDPRCNDLPCTDYVRNTFTNLNTGVYVSNGNQYAFTIDKSIFTNCLVGTNARFSLSAKILRNNYFVRENTSYKTAGLVLNASNMYKVEENTFNNVTLNNPINGVLSYGIVVINSGPNHNEIYNNSFTNLKVGGQSEGINANDKTDRYSKGLQWKCNKFFNQIVLADLTVLNGRIDFQQGYKTTLSATLARQLAAKNQFSRNGEGMPLEHDIAIDAASQRIQYVHLADANQTPDSYTTLTNPFKVTPLRSEAPVGSPVYMTANGCPSKIISTSSIDVEKGIAQVNEEITELQKKIDGGDTPSLIDLVKNTSPLNELIPESINQLVQTLLKNSPYLSDEVLNAYLDRNPNRTHLKHILIANSNLSQQIKDRVATMEMLSGVRNQINAAQTGTSPRSELYQNIQYLDNQITEAKGELFYIFQTDSTSMDSLLTFLEKSTDIEFRKVLLEIYIQNGDLEKEQLLRNELLAKGVSQEFLDITTVQKQISTYASDVDALNENQALVSTLTNFKDNAQDVFVKTKASNILANWQNETILEPFLDFDDNKSLIQEQTNPDSENLDQIPLYVSIYPNPSTGLVNLDFANIPDGKMDVQLVDLSGKIVYQNSYENTNGESIDLSAVHKGMYLVKVLIDKQLVEVQKLELK